METVITTVISVLASVAITHIYAERYFRKQNAIAEQASQQQEARAEQLFVAMMRTLENIYSATHPASDMKIAVKPDEQGRIANVNLTIVPAPGVVVPSASAKAALHTKSWNNTEHIGKDGL